MNKLYAAYNTLKKLKAGNSSTDNIKDWVKRCYEAMNDDFNSSKLIAELFEASRIINSVNDGKASLIKEDLETLENYFNIFFFDILGMKLESNENADSETLEKIMELVLEIRKNAKETKNWAVADAIRSKLNESGIVIKDTKDGAIWEKI